MDRRRVLTALLVVIVLAGWALSVADGRAKERALDREAAFLESRLSNASCVDSYGTDATTDSERASVVGRGLDGWRVRVAHPYWYGTDEVEADTISEAVYVVPVGDGAARLLRREPLGLPC